MQVFMFQGITQHAVLMPILAWHHQQWFGGMFRACLRRRCFVAHVLVLCGGRQRDSGVTAPCSFDGTAQGAGRRHPVCRKCGSFFFGWLRTMICNMLQ